MGKRSLSSERVSTSEKKWTASIKGTSSNAPRSGKQAGHRLYLFAPFLPWHIAAQGKRDCLVSRHISPGPAHLERCVIIVDTLLEIAPLFSVESLMSLALTTTHENCYFQRSIRRDTVGEPPSAENCASHMPLLKVQEPGELNAAIAAVSRGNRFANSIRRFCETLFRGKWSQG